MKFKLLKEEGYEFAILGAMLSKGKVNFETFENEIPQELKERATNLAPRLAGADYGHNKYLEQMQYWMVIQAPLYFWKQFDTYRIGVSKSSESTMFKMWKKGFDKSDFENSKDIFPETILSLNREVAMYAINPSPERFRNIITNLPDGYLQTRLVNVNAKSLRNIYIQRKNHMLPEWKTFCKWIETLPHGDLITQGKTGPEKITSQKLIANAAELQKYTGVRERE